MSMQKIFFIATTLVSCVFHFGCLSDTKVGLGSKDISIIPEPQNLEKKEGVFLFSNNTKIKSDEALADLTQLIKQELYESTRLRFDGLEKNTLHLVLSQEVMEEEGYLLDISPEKIIIKGKTPNGIFYGYQTLKQLMPVEVFKKGGNIASLTIPCVKIKDSPRFSYRGVHLDVGRHFFSVEEVKSYIDILAMHKVNNLHWHLTEDQGWRIEIKKYPKLTEIGAYRKGTVKGLLWKNFGFDNKPYGGYYTQKEAKEIVAYAQKRFINVIPEIELPGHAQAAIASYPELGNTNEPVEVLQTWGVSENVYNVNDKTIAFLKDVFDEICEIFPSKYIHIGGDECPKTQWKNSPEAQAKIAELGLKNEEELQSWFIEQFDQYLSAKGRKIIGWDEILEGGLSAGATVMSWRGEKGGIEAAKKEHDVIMTPNTYAYLDYYQGASSKEPLAIGGYLPLRRIYRWDPCNSGIPHKYHKHIIGAQCNLWSEYFKNFEHVIYMAYPRACAVAEVQWTLPENKNFQDFIIRMNKHYLRLLNAGYSVHFPDCDMEELSFSLAEKEVEFTVSLPKATNGFYQPFFHSVSGDEVEYESVSLKLGDKIVDSETHYGFSGAFDQGSVYTLSAGKPTEEGEVTLIVKAKAVNGKPVSGKVILRRF